MQEASMPKSALTIVVAICTFRRDSLAETIKSVSEQELPPDSELSIVVADNDDRPGAQELVERIAADLGLTSRYVHAPARNISLARNACLKHAIGDVLLFIDDDETADPGWIKKMIGQWRSNPDVGVVFGPALAVYPPDAPEWMQNNDFHSNIPTANQGVVETGFSSNVLMDLSDPRVREARFDPSFGRTGGEDVDFFFRLHRAGIRMTICEDGIVREEVARSRINLRWLLRRRHTTGAIYGTCVAPNDAIKRNGVLLRSAAKAAYCALRALAAANNRTRCSFWTMRASFHAGVVSGCISPPRREVYGQS